MSRYVVGDLHGCYSKFNFVLNRVEFDPKKDILYSVGDFADRGEPEEISQTLLYLDLLHNNYPQSFQSVFGNHDIWLYQWFEDIFDTHCMGRDAWETWEHNGGRNTVRALASIPEDIQRSIYEWMGNLPYRIELEDYVIQHTTIRYDDLFKDIRPTDLTLKKCLDEEICSRDYDAWFWDRYVLYSSKSVFKEKSVPLLGQEYTPTGKHLITGHTPLPKGPFFDRELNLIDIDTGSFILKEKYNTDVDGEVCILNLDNLHWVKSNGEEGEF